MANFSTLRLAQQPQDIVQGQPPYIPVNATNVLSGKSTFQNISQEQEGMANHFQHVAYNYAPSQPGCSSHKGIMRQEPERFQVTNVRNPQVWIIPSPIVPEVDLVNVEKPESVVDEESLFSDLLSMFADNNPNEGSDIAVSPLSQTQVEPISEDSISRWVEDQLDSNIPDLGSSFSQLGFEIVNTIDGVGESQICDLNAQNEQSQPLFTPLEVMQLDLPDSFSPDRKCGAVSTSGGSPSAFEVHSVVATNDSPIEEAPGKRGRGRPPKTTPKSNQLRQQNISCVTNSPLLSSNSFCLEGDTTSFSSVSDEDYQPPYKKTSIASTSSDSDDCRSPLYKTFQTGKFTTVDRRAQNNLSSRVSRRKRAHIDKENEIKCQQLVAENKALREQKSILDGEIKKWEAKHMELVLQLTERLWNIQ